MYRAIIICIPQLLGDEMFMIQNDKTRTMILHKFNKKNLMFTKIDRNIIYIDRYTMMSCIIFL